MVKGLGDNGHLPGGVGFDDGVADGEQLAHTRRQGHLLGLACGQQALITGSDGWVAPGSHQGCHIQSRPQLPPAALHGAFAPPLSAVPVVGSDPGQGGDFLMAVLSQFGQLSDEGGGEDRPHAGDLTGVCKGFELGLAET